MEFVSQLWLPIVVSAFLVWIASFLAHMVLPHHKGDFAGMPNEAAAIEALRGTPPGSYFFPYGDMQQMKDPAFIEKQKSSPNGVLHVWAGPANMGRNIMLSFVFYLLVGFFVAYMSWHALGGGTPAYLTVFRIVGVGAFMAHGLGWMPHMIWFGGKGFWAYVFDSLLFACVTAGTFGWLWPR